MNRPPPRSTRSYKLFPYTAIVRSAAFFKATTTSSSAMIRSSRSMTVLRKPGGFVIGYKNRQRLRQDMKPGWRFRRHLAVGVDCHRGCRIDFEQIGRAPSELQSLMRISYAVFCLKKNIKKIHK